MALLAVVAAAVVVAVVLLGNGDPYEVKVRFANASQLVDGNLVQVAGTKVGKVVDIRLTDDGQAEVTLEVEEPTAPLRRGTVATVRQASLSGVANRYVDLRLAGADAPQIASGGTIGSENTVSAVDLDELFNTLDEDTRESLQKVIQGSARQYVDETGEGEGEQLRAGLRYLSPSFAASARLFRALDSDEAMLERFVVESSRLVTDVAERRDDLAGLIDGLATTTGAIGSERVALADAIETLPPFMRRANSTFLNLRATLDDLAPLVEESKPVAPKLSRLLAEVRPFAEGARPTLRDLSLLTRKPGAQNDLVELNRSAPAVRDLAVREVRDNGATRPGLFPTAIEASRGSVPTFAVQREYAVDILAWFDDFSHSGVYDALGGASRVGPHVSAFNFAAGIATPIDVPLRGTLFEATAEQDQRDRCPGAADHAFPDGSNPRKPPNVDCDPSQRLPGD